MRADISMPRGRRESLKDGYDQKGLSPENLCASACVCLCVCVSMCVCVSCACLCVGLYVYLCLQKRDGMIVS